MSSVKYRPEIDGLRAFAVIPVILFHLGFEWIPGGFIGVDVFLVISGFLITKIILQESDQGIFKFSEFWLRRIRRILPALLTMIFFTSIAGLWLIYRPEIYELGRQGLASSFSVANIYFWRLTGGYWGPGAENSPLLHTWTLSVEEQFYLFFPLIIFFILRYRTELLAPILAILVVSSFLLFAYGTKVYPAATFYLLPTRAWELGLGCLLAIVDHRKYFRNILTYRPQLNALYATSGLLGIIFSYLLISGDEGLNLYLAIPVLGSVLVIAFSFEEKSLIYRILTCSPIVYVGKISYSLYLWHWPVIVLSKSVFLDGKSIFSPILAIPIFSIISIVSYHFVEKTTRRRQGVERPILIAFAVVVVFSTILTFSNAVEDLSEYSETAWEGNSYSVTPFPQRTEFGNRRMMGITEPLNPDFNMNAFAEGGTLRLHGGDTPDVIVLGDSHALMWSALLDGIFEELSVSASFYAADATATFFEIPVTHAVGNRYFPSREKFIFDEKRLHYLQEWKPKVVVISARWSNVRNLDETQDLLNYIQSIGSNIILIESPPELFIGDRNAPAFLSHINLKPQEGKRKYIQIPISPRHEIGLRLVDKISEQCDKCTLLPIADLFMNGEEVWVLNGSDVLYIDDDHLSSKGALVAKDRIKKALMDNL